MEIKTDHKYRPLKWLCELPDEVAKDFDYVDEEDVSLRFVKYKGGWYDTHDTQRITTEPYLMGWDMPVAKDHILAKWDAVLWDTFFSAMVYKFSEDWESVIVGRYCA